MNNKKSFDINELCLENNKVSFLKQVSIVLKLSLPGMMAQLSSILMQYIDSAMVGSLGAASSASIGLVASSTWLIGSILHGTVIGFTVQVAHSIGAKEKEKSKNIFFNGFLFCLLLSLVVALIASSFSFKIPYLLGGKGIVAEEGAWYFLIFILASPFFEIVYFISGMLQCSGNMKIPGFMNALMCFLDIVFNYLFIFVFDLGVKGAALGSLVAALCVSVFMAVYVFKFSEYFKIRKEDSCKIDGKCIKQALKLAFPVVVESSAFSGALVVVTRIIAPLGQISLAANSFATTAESLCYMGAYGIQEAATTLVGQSYGAKQKKLVDSFSFITVLYGIILMAVGGAAMYFLCPYIFKFITSDVEIQKLSVEVLRIELFAEPLFGASIVAMGCLRGKGDTLIPSLLNLFSLWVVRLSLSLILVKPLGLHGIWIAMAVELCFRGIVMMARLAFGKK